MDISGSKQTHLNLKLDYRIIAAVLLVIIAIMLLVWKPWQGAKATDRTIAVTGNSTISARPDEFVFYPTYEFKHADKQAAINELTAKSNEVVGKLKELGVADSKIKTNSDSWGYPAFFDESKTAPTYTLRLTVTVDSQELAQKVQDYLLTTTPTGTISPQATFSDKKRKELESKGRDQAAQEARAKADQSAKNLGFKIAGVKSVDDGTGFGGIYRGLDSKAAVADSIRPTQPSATIQPGENELTYSVTVTYYIK